MLGYSYVSKHFAGKIGTMCESQNFWMEIIDRQLFPIMSYGCHLWDLDRTDVKRTINKALRKGVRKRLGMKMNESDFEYLVSLSNFTSKRFVCPKITLQGP